MDFSSSSSTTSSLQREGPILPANTSKPLWELPIYETTPCYPPPPPMENRVFTLNSQEISSNYSYNYTNFNYNGGGDGGGASTATTAELAVAKRQEGGGEGEGEGEGFATAEREHMFDKVVTPSDVGKLNRLVIPKQHAEKYFPLDSSSDEKGLLLNFEDRNGKSWRFRYSYWNSSQSYVMTKGWSRFVKDKKLDAGDIVSFQRGVGDVGRDRFYIDWRRRLNTPPSYHPHHHNGLHTPETLQFQHGFSLLRSIHTLPPTPFVHQARDHTQVMGIFAHPVSPNLRHQGSVFYLRGAAPQQQMQMQMQAGSSRGDQIGGAAHEPMVSESVPVVHGKAAAKRLRLFGVNMDCTVSDPQTAVLSSPQLVPSQHRPHLLLDSQISSSGEAALQLSLHNTASSTSTSNIDFLDKGKSSMCLDFEI